MNGSTTHTQQQFNAGHHSNDQQREQRDPRLRKTNLKIHGHSHPYGDAFERDIYAKKMKTQESQTQYNISVSNKFDSLSSNDDTFEDMDTQTENRESQSGHTRTRGGRNDKSSQAKSVKIPPIVIRNNVKSFDEFKSEITCLAGEDKFKLQFTREGTKVFLEERGAYDALITKLKTNNSEFYTYSMQKPKHLILKGLPKIEDNLIKDEISKTVSCTRLIKIKQKSEEYQPIYMASFDPATNLNEVRKIKYIQSVRIKWEKYKRSKGATQCYRCQEFGHGTDSCNNVPKCVKCDQQHLTKTCTKDPKTTPYCVNCKGEHRANSSVCPEYKKRMELIHKRRIQRAPATSGGTSTSAPPRTTEHFPQPSWAGNDQHANYWHRQQWQQPPITPKEDGQSDLLRQIKELRELKSELDKFNTLCNLSQLVNFIRMANEKLTGSKSLLDQAQIIDELLKNGAPGALS